MIITVLFLAVSLISVVMQTRNTLVVLRGKPYPGMVRTASCRVGAASLYAALGLVTLFTQPSATGVIALSVFAVIQCVWILNGLADARLARKGRQYEHIEQ